MLSYTREGKVGLVKGKRIETSLWHERVEFEPRVHEQNLVLQLVAAYAGTVEFGAPSIQIALRIITLWMPEVLLDTVCSFFVAVLRYMDTHGDQKKRSLVLYLG